MCLSKKVCQKILLTGQLFCSAISLVLAFICPAKVSKRSDMFDDQPLFTSLPIFHGKHYAGKNPMQCCPWGFRQQCKRIKYIWCCFNIVRKEGRGGGGWVFKVLKKGGSDFPHRKRGVGKMEEKGERGISLIFILTYPF